MKTFQKLMMLGFIILFFLTVANSANAQTNKKIGIRLKTNGIKKRISGIKKKM
jgi:hypothetical protein